MCDAIECTLREALVAAQNGDLINFSALFNTPQTINLLTALPDITRSITGGVAVGGVTIAGGRAGNGNFGGGINSQSNLTLTDVHLTDNTAGSGGGGFLNVAPITTDKINANAGLAALALNGGATPTHALIFGSGSLALDRGNSSGATADQRGLTRPIDLAGITNTSDGSDIGAFEAQSAPVAPIPPTVTLLWQKQVSDLGPFRAVRTPVLRQLGMQDRRFGWTVEMQVRAIQQGLIVTEVPVRVLERIGHSKISGTFKGVLGAAHGIFSTIAALWFSERMAHLRLRW